MTRCDPPTLLEYTWGDDVLRWQLEVNGFRDFAFANAVRLHGGMNPGFFKGTVVEKATADLLAEG